MAWWQCATFVIPPCQILCYTHTVQRFVGEKQITAPKLCSATSCSVAPCSSAFFDQFVIHVVRGWRGATCVSLETSLVCLLPFWTSLWLHCHPFQQHSYFAAHVWLGVQLHYTFPQLILRATGKGVQLINWKMKCVVGGGILWEAMPIPRVFITCVCVSCSVMRCCVIVREEEEI